MTLEMRDSLAVMDTSFISKYLAPMDEGVQVFWDDRSEDLAWQRFYGVVMRLSKHDYESYFFLERKYKYERIRTREGWRDFLREVESMIRRCLREGEYEEKLFRRLPYVRAFWSTIKKECLDAEGKFKLEMSPKAELVDAWVNDDARKFVSEYNALAESLRTVLRSEGTRDMVKGFRRNATERYKQLMTSAHQAWSLHSKNLLIRLDWGFRQKLPYRQMSTLSWAEFSSEMRKVDQCRKQKLRLLRKLFGSDLTFFAWKIECQERKGIHMHWLIAINGSRHQDRIGVPKSIADVWDAHVGDGETYTWNVNAMNQENSNIANLRVLSYDDPVLMPTLGWYCDYLTKVDYTVKLRMPRGMRSMGCSKVRSVPMRRGPKRGKKMAPLDWHAVRGPKGDRA